MCPCRDCGPSGTNIHDVITRGGHVANAANAAAGLAELLKDLSVIFVGGANVSIQECANGTTEATRTPSIFKFIGHKRYSTFITSLKEEEEAETRLTKEKQCGL